MNAQVRVHRGQTLLTLNFLHFYVFDTLLFHICTVVIDYFSSLIGDNMHHFVGKFIKSEIAYSLIKELKVLEQSSFVLLKIKIQNLKDFQVLEMPCTLFAVRSILSLPQLRKQLLRQDQIFNLFSLGDQPQVWMC